MCIVVRIIFFTLLDSWTLIDELFSGAGIDWGFEMLFCVIIYDALTKCATPKLFRLHRSVGRRYKQLFRSISVRTYFDYHRCLAAFQWDQVITLKRKGKGVNILVQFDKATMGISFVPIVSFGHLLIDRGCD